MSIQSLRNLYKKWVSFKETARTKSKTLYWILDTFEVIVVAGSIALVIRTYVIQTSLVPTGSMIPTLNVGDRLFVNRFIYRFSPPHRGDIVVFRSPIGDGKDYVKRCVGIPGDTLRVLDGDVYINGKLESFAGVDIQNDFFNYGPKFIPKDHYFMMGDNRGNSYDSRYWGFVTKQALLGKALFTFWPLGRMRVLH